MDDGFEKTRAIPLTVGISTIDWVSRMRHARGKVCLSHDERLIAVWG